MRDQIRQEPERFAFGALDAPPLHLARGRGLQAKATSWYPLGRHASGSICALPKRRMEKYAS